MKNKKVEKVGTSFAELLLLTFIVLKLCGVITWSWWWVLSPLWITFIVFVAIVVIFALLTR